MKHLQKWFERMAGYTQEEREREALARRIFGQQTDISSLQKPACWRRAARSVRLAA